MAWQLLEWQELVDLRDLERRLTIIDRWWIAPAGRHACIFFFFFKFRFRGRGSRSGGARRCGRSRGHGP